MQQEPENILVIERQALGTSDLFQGLNFDIERYLPLLLDPRQHRFVPRPDAENDPALKQLIPYFVICLDDKVWCYRRGGKPGEKRLADRYSLGVGGHINDRDHDDNGNIYRQAALRELNEEIVVPSDARDTIGALLNDDSNPVGCVHLGVVHVLMTANAEIEPREETIREAGFKTRAELQILRPKLETWSQLVLDGLDELLNAARESRETGSTQGK